MCPDPKNTFWFPDYHFRNLGFCITLQYSTCFPTIIYLFKVNNRNSSTRCETNSKLIIKATKRGKWCRCGVSIIDFKQLNISWVINRELNDLKDKPIKWLTQKRNLLKNSNYAQLEYWNGNFFGKKKNKKWKKSWTKFIKHFNEIKQNCTVQENYPNFVSLKSFGNSYNFIQCFLYWILSATLLAVNRTYTKSFKSILILCPRVKVKSFNFSSKIGTACKIWS